MKTHYILKGKKPVPLTIHRSNPLQNGEDLIKWMLWMDDHDRTVCRDEIGTICISTVFIGLDYMSNVRKPLLFETHVFGGNFNGYQERYSTWEEAEKGHQRILRKVKKEIKSHSR